MDPSAAYTNTQEAQPKICHSSKVDDVGDIFFNQPLLVMPSHTESLSNAVKVFTTLMLKSAEMDPKIAHLFATPENLNRVKLTNIQN